MSIANADTNNTLIIQPLPGIGDMIWNLPFIHAIARQTASGRVTLLAKRRSKADQLLSSDRYIADIIWLERSGGEHTGPGGIRRLAADLRRRQFRCVWILHHSVRYALVAKLAGIPRRIGYGVGSQRWFLSRGQYLPAGAVPRHPIEAGASLLRHLQVALDSVQPDLPVAAARQQIVRRQWQMTPDIIHIVVGIGSSEVYKIWPQQRFTGLLQKIHCRQAGKVRFYLFGGGEKEQAAADWIGRQTRPAGVDVVSALNIPIDEAVHLLSLADLYVGNDTGFLNVAAALKIRVIGIFGASPPLQYSESIYPVLPPGGALESYERSGRGIHSISVDAVYNGVIEQLTLLPGAGQRQITLHED
jgi:heptosyltransferase-2